VLILSVNQTHVTLLTAAASAADDAECDVVAGQQCGFLLRCLLMLQADLGREIDDGSDASQL